MFGDGVCCLVWHFSPLQFSFIKSRHLFSEFCWSPLCIGPFVPKAMNHSLDLSLLTVRQQLRVRVRESIHNYRLCQEETRGAHLDAQHLLFPETPGPSGLSSMTTSLELQHANPSNGHGGDSSPPFGHHRRGLQGGDAGDMLSLSIRSLSLGMSLPSPSPPNLLSLSTTSTVCSMSMSMSPSRSSTLTSFVSSHSEVMTETPPRFTSKRTPDAPKKKSRRSRSPFMSSEVRDTLRSKRIRFEGGELWFLLVQQSKVI